MPVKLKEDTVQEEIQLLPKVVDEQHNTGQPMEHTKIFVTIARREKKDVSEMANVSIQKSWRPGLQVFHHPVFYYHKPSHPCQYYYLQPHKTMLCCTPHLLTSILWYPRGISCMMQWPQLINCLRNGVGGLSVQKVLKGMEARTWHIREILAMIRKSRGCNAPTGFPGTTAQQIGEWQNCLGWTGCLIETDF